jgi:hypothetical protein
MIGSITVPSGACARPRFAWLLWFALLLPLAQAAANWHALSHWGDQPIARSGDQQTGGSEPCHLCLAAAPLAGGGAASAPLQVAHSELPYSIAVLHAGGFRLAPLWALYESRAPPFASR